MNRLGYFKGSIVLKQKRHSISETLYLLQSGALSPQQLTAAHIETIKELNPKLNALVNFTENMPPPKETCAKSRNLLKDIPIVVKDNFCVQSSSIPTTASSSILSSFHAPYTASAVSSLQSEGAVLLGKANLDEFGMGSFTSNSFYGPTLHPTDLLRSPGGSSGGSACAVASEMAMAALGSDTGGSVRLPASYCGLVGLKPTYGRISRWGLIAYASSLDCVGILGGSISDVGRVLASIEGWDEKDPVSLKTEEGDCVDIGLLEGTSTSTSNSNRDRDRRMDLKGKRIGIPQEFRVEELSECMAEVWERGIRLAEERGAEIVPVSIPSVPYSLPCYYILAAAESSSNLSRYTGLVFGKSGSGNGSLEEEKEKEEGDMSLQEHIFRQRSKGLGREVQKRILAGTFVLSDEGSVSFFQKAQKVRSKLCEEFDSVFSKSGKDQGVDFLLTPTSTGSAPLLSSISNSSNAEEGYYEDIMTVPSSLAGLPSLSIPFGECKDGLPLGLQLIGPHQSDARLLAHGNALSMSIPL